MTDIERQLREKIERTGDAGGDLHLELAEHLIEMGEYDDACECLLFCIGADTVVRENAYPLIVDLLAMGKCIDVVPHMTFEWLRLSCYIEPEKKKAMYMGIALGTKKLNMIANALECYVLDFGGDANVGAMYDRLEEETFLQDPDADYYDYYFFELAHSALARAVECGLEPSCLGNARLVDICSLVDKGEAAARVRKYILENRDRDTLRASLFCNFNSSLDAVSELVGYCAEVQNYDALIWIYTECVTDCPWDADEANERVYAPIIDSILGANDVNTVAEFIKANEETFGDIYTDLRMKICRFVSKEYLDGAGNVRSLWGNLTEVYTMLADFIFDTVPSDTLAFYSEFNAALVRDAFSSSADCFTDEELLRSFREYDGRIALASIYGYLTFGDDKDKMLSDIKTALSLVREKYF